MRQEENTITSQGASKKGYHYFSKCIKEDSTKLSQKGLEAESTLLSSWKVRISVYALAISMMAEVTEGTPNGSSAEVCQKKSCSHSTQHTENQVKTYGDSKTSK